ncbi:hypothetical protein OPQ81_007788 [Rhizoctonia solani]|nr:hypothetical protein OPQ81_007788 [Rhizoctonia solani]
MKFSYTLDDHHVAEQNVISYVISILELGSTTLHVDLCLVHQFALVNFENAGFTAERGAHQYPRPTTLIILQKIWLAFCSDIRSFGRKARRKKKLLIILAIQEHERLCLPFSLAMT